MKYLYSDELNLYFLLGKYRTLVITPNELDILEKEKKPKLDINIYELAKECPISIVERELKRNKIKAETILCDEFYLEKFVNKYFNKEDRLFMLDILREYYIQIPYRKVLNQINILTNIIKFNKLKNNKKLDIERAKQVPISNFIEFRNGVAKSIWKPNERTPSMHYYENENRVWCFATNQGGDVIEVVMKKFDLSFINAVKFLTQ